MSAFMSWGMRTASRFGWEGNWPAEFTASRVGGLFAGESMFHSRRDASKVALFHLMRHLGERGYLLFDIQQLTPHTASLGAKEIARTHYLKRLRAAVEVEVTFGSIDSRAL